MREVVHPEQDAVEQEELQELEQLIFEDLGRTLAEGSHLKAPHQHVLSSHALACGPQILDQVYTGEHLWMRKLLVPLLHSCWVSDSDLGNHIGKSQPGTI